MSLLEQNLQLLEKQNAIQSAPAYAAFEPVFEQHAIDAAFLWLLRSQVINSSTLHTAEDIAEMDGRIAGNLQGLLAAGPLGWDVCLQQLELEEAGETFVAAVLAFQSADAAKMKLVCEIARNNPEMVAGLISAFGWINETAARQWSERFLLVKDSYYRFLGVAACCIRRIDPKQQLSAILQEPEILEQDARLHARCLRLIGEMKRYDLVPALNQAMNSEDELIQFWANWSAVLLGNQAAADKLKAHVLQNRDDQDRALMLLLNYLPLDKSREWLAQISQDPENLRTVIKSAGILGDTQVIPWLIKQMHDPQQARIAGLSFNLMTGIDLELSNLSKENVIEFEDNPDGDIEDDAESEDNDLAWPDPVKVRSFWDKHGSSYGSGKRYFMGKPVESENLKSVVYAGNQRQRACAALKLAVLEPDKVLQNIAVTTVQL